MRELLERRQAADSPVPISYSFTELAKMSGWSRGYWYKLKYQGLLPTFRVGGSGPERVYHADVINLFPESEYCDQRQAS